jgi:hypothetical protein
MFSRRRSRESRSSSRRQEAGDCPGFVGEIPIEFRLPDELTGSGDEARVRPVGLVENGVRVGGERDRAIRRAHDSADHDDTVGRHAPHIDVVAAVDEQRVERQRDEPAHARRR